MPQAIHEIRIAIQVLLLLFSIAAAFRWGAGPERASAAALLFLFLIDWPYHWLVGRGAVLHQVDVGHFLMDLTTWIALYATAMKANRLYTLWLAAFQLVMVLSHFARGSPAIAPLAYGIMSILPSYGHIVILCIGVYCHYKRTKRYGSYRSWRIS